MQQVIRRNAILLLFGDGISFISGLFITLVFRHGEWPSQSLLIEHFIPFGALLILWIAVFFIAGLYDTHIGFIRKDVPGLILKAQVINMLLAALVFFILPIGITPKTTLALYLIVSTTLIVCWRLFVLPRLSFGTAARAVIVGSGEEAKEVSRILNENPQFGCICIDVVDIRLYPSAAGLKKHFFSLFPSNISTVSLRT